MGLRFSFLGNFAGKDGKRKTERGAGAKKPKKNRHPLNPVFNPL